jgi:DNA-binding CsgD family transcriptional regulator
MFNNHQMFEWIKNQTALNGFAPTQAQIAAQFGVSITAIHKRLHRQATKGKVDLTRNAHGIAFNGAVSLTPMQFKIKSMLSGGLTQTAIAKALEISTASVCEHVKKLREKGAFEVPETAVA